MSDDRIELTKTKDTLWLRAIIFDHRAAYQKEDVIGINRFNHESVWAVLAWVIKGWHFRSVS